MKKIFTALAIVLYLPSIVIAGNLVQAGEGEIIAPNQGALIANGKEIRAQLSKSGCASGFEAACSPTRQRSEYLPHQSHQHGDRVVYRWEVMIPKSLKYNGGHLYSTRFLDDDNRMIFQFLIGEEYGYEIDRKPCFGPEGFGSWHKVEFRVVWDSTKKKKLSDKTPGEIHVSCDGNEIISSTGRPNIAEGGTVRLALGVEGALDLADGDNVEVNYRNLQIDNW